MIDVLPHLKNLQPVLAQQSGLISELLDMSAREAENDGTHSNNERAVAITMLTDMWLSFTEFIDSKPHLNGVIFNLL